MKSVTTENGSYRSDESGYEYADLISRIVDAGPDEKELVLDRIANIKNKTHLGIALRALYRQQVKIGFILTDPLTISGDNEKYFKDADTGVTFRMQWNPDRELRREHRLLIDRGIVNVSVDPEKFINRDEKGKPCYLCSANIELQNPKEIQVPITLGEERFFIGANFASITDNHFTVMNGDHRPQEYRSLIPQLMNDFIDLTEGAFRIVFNGLAGASIKGHEHFQATSELFPVEEIHFSQDDILLEDGNTALRCPSYYVPLLVIEGKKRDAVEAWANRIITLWEKSGPGLPTENILATLKGEVYRMFIFFRDKTRLAGPGKMGVMATFEAGGILVMSFRPPDGTSGIDELKTFQAADLDTIRRMLRGIAPEKVSSATIIELIEQKEFS